MLLDLPQIIEKFIYLRFSQPGSSDALDFACNFSKMSDETPARDILRCSAFPSRRGFRRDITSSKDRPVLLADSNEGRGVGRAITA
jgi:hypothetical protein